MTEKKLTPRVGDRVIVNPPSGRTYVGDVTAITGDRTERPFDVTIDGLGEPPWRCRLNELTVVDRRPVEWPNGWRRLNSTIIEVDAGDPNPARLTRAEFDKIRGPEGDYVAEHLDELLGGDS